MIHIWAGTWYRSLQITVFDPQLNRFLLQIDGHFQWLFSLYIVPLKWSFIVIRYTFAIRMVCWAER